ncbi:hypothetical protein P154DRAFT_250812 [Amniculicola lignicola CBS 123094]|uniref:Uncharacterized protein n=1 Tax=Amniculicola lignicola CBS 123094 TaxID=1392246 RepID=A0A6A5WAG4_9PLEO|nr:hypothetical protein P154DRAFT_250812 [Amniculicola lignicola CBS 123094]
MRPQAAQTLPQHSSAIARPSLCTWQLSSSLSVYFAFIVAARALFMGSAAPPITPSCAKEPRAASFWTQVGWFRGDWSE